MSKYFVCFYIHIQHCPLNFLPSKYPFRRYQVGLGNAIEFKDAENTYLNAQLNYYSNLLDYNVSAAELERVIGAPIKISETDL